MISLLPSCCYYIRNSYLCPCTCVRNHYTWYGIAESKVLYWDTTIKYFIKEQLLYAMAAIVILIIFVLSPALLLFCYPTKIFRKCSSYCRHRRWQALHIFAEKFQGCYKDGVDAHDDSIGNTFLGREIFYNHQKPTDHLAEEQREINNSGSQDGADVTTYAITGKGGPKVWRSPERSAKFVGIPVAIAELLSAWYRGVVSRKDRS